MKFRCERDVLTDALGTAGRGATSRGGALPVLAGVRLVLSGDRLQLTGTDLDLTIEVTVTVAGDADGTVVLPARLASEIVRALPAGAVTIDATEDEARITAGRTEYSLRLLPAEEFPKLPESTSPAVSLDAAEFAEALRQVVRAASGDDARPILTGVLMAAEPDGLRLVATDSYRLAVRDLPGTTVLDEGQKVLVPSRALGELSRALSGAERVEVRIGAQDVTFQVGDRRLTSRLIEGEFPNYRQIIPTSYPNTLTIDRHALLESLKRVKLLAREAAPVRLVQRQGSVELLATTQDVGQAHDELDASFEGEELTVAFNPEYLIDGIEALTDDELTLQTRDQLNACLLRSTERTDYVYVLMPVRVT